MCDAFACSVVHECNSDKKIIIITRIDFILPPKASITFQNFKKEIEIDDLVLEFNKAPV